MRLLDRLSIRDLRLIAQLKDVKSLRDLARSNTVDPGTISRLIKSIEEDVGFVIATRSSSQFRLTLEGLAFVTIAQEILGRVDSMGNISINSVGANGSKVCTIGTRGFLATYLSGELAKSSAAESVRFRLVDAPPSNLRLAALDQLVDVVIHIEPWTWPNKWVTESVGNLSWSYIVRDGHPLANNSERSDLQAFSLIGSCFLSDDGIKSSLVQPHSIAMSSSHEVQTTFSAIAMLRNSDAVGYLPLLAVKDELEAGLLRRVNVAGCAPRVDPILVTSNQDSVKKSTLRKIVKALAMEEA